MRIGIKDLVNVGIFVYFKRVFLNVKSIILLVRYSERRYSFLCLCECNDLILLRYLCIIKKNFLVIFSYSKD